ncbi:MAG: hypothetical protein Q9188_000951 [Gyalolechia gomerana]
MSTTQQPQMYPFSKTSIKSPLGRHRILAPSAGVKISAICLGAMNFGNAWKDCMGECSKATAWEMLDYFYEMGGNFIDTYVASNYQTEESEQWLGEWMEERGRRDEMVIATKFCGPWELHDGTNHMIQSNFGGGASKNLHVCVEASFKKLKTSYIDLVVVQANSYARHHGLRPFSVYQGRWSAAERDFERDIIPMCMEQGMGLCRWGVLGGGYFKPSSQVGKDGGRNLSSVAVKNAALVTETLAIVAERKGTLITSVALAYVEHLRGNIEALSLRLDGEVVEEIERAYPFELGFPAGFLVEENVLANRYGTFDRVGGWRPIVPGESG